MVEVNTKSGFKCELPEDAVDNMELVDALAEMQGDDDMLSISRVVSLLLGKDLKKKLYDHVRVNGRVPIAAISEEVKEIFAAFGEHGKNC